LHPYFHFWGPLWTRKVHLSKQNSPQRRKRPPHIPKHTLSLVSEVICYFWNRVIGYLNLTRSAQSYCVWTCRDFVDFRTSFSFAWIAPQLSLGSYLLQSIAEWAFHPLNDHWVQPWSQMLRKFQPPESHTHLLFTPHLILPISRLGSRFRRFMVEI